MVKLYTPGHGPYTDALIMYAITSALLHREYDFKVKGVEGTYIIETDAKLEEVAEAVSDHVQSIRDGAIYTLVDRLRLIQKQSRNRLLIAMNKIADETKALEYLKELLFPGHGVSEGRGAKGVILWLSLSPFAGKFFTGSFKYNVLEYRVCLQCVAMASTGLISTFMPLDVRKRGKRTGKVYVTVLAFTGHVDSDALKSLKKALGEERFLREYDVVARSSENIPLRVLPFILLTILGGKAVLKLAESRASWKTYTVAYDVKKATQIRGFSELSIDTILSGLSTLHKRNVLDDLRTFVMGVVKGIGSDVADPYILESLVRYFNTRNVSDLYQFVRAAKSNLEGELGNIVGKRSLGVKLCRELARLAV